MVAPIEVECSSIEVLLFVFGEFLVWNIVS